MTAPQSTSAPAEGERCQQTTTGTPRGMEALRCYVEMRRKVPLKGLGDSVHHIHASTEFEAELRFSDLEAIVASGDVRAAVIEECAKVITSTPIYHGQTGYVAIQARDKQIMEGILALSQAPATDADDKVRDLALFIGNESRIYAGLEPYEDIEGPGWDSCRRLALALIAAGRIA